MVALEITGGGAPTVNVRVALAVPEILVAPKVTVDVPTPEGVPEITPVDVLMDKPAGNPVAL